MSKYKVHMVSFRNTEDSGYNVIMGTNNVQPWHLVELEKYLETLRTKLAPVPGEEFV